jgi:hypothetical protein
MTSAYETWTTFLHYKFVTTRSKNDAVKLLKTTEIDQPLEWLDAVSAAEVERVADLEPGIVWERHRTIIHNRERYLPVDGQILPTKEPIKVTWIICLADASHGFECEGVWEFNWWEWNGMRAGDRDNLLQSISSVVRGPSPKGDGLVTSRGSVTSS